MAADPDQRLMAAYPAVFDGALSDFTDSILSSAFSLICNASPSHVPLGEVSVRVYWSSVKYLDHFVYKILVRC